MSASEGVRLEPIAGGEAVGIPLAAMLALDLIVKFFFALDTANELF